MESIYSEGVHFVGLNPQISTPNGEPETRKKWVLENRVIHIRRRKIPLISTAKLFCNFCPQAKI